MMPLKGMILDQALGFHRSISFYAMLNQSLKSIFNLIGLIGIISIGIAQTQLGSDINGESGEGENFGLSVSMDSDGDRVAVGDELNDGTGTDAGHVRVYEYSGGSWSQLGADIDGERAGDLFGVSVSLDSDGSHVAIGAEENDGRTLEEGATQVYNNVGHVRVYQYSGGSWSQLGADIDGKTNGDHTGVSVSLDSDGSHVAIGSPDNGKGHVRVYEYSGGSWSQLGADIDGEAAGDLFGGAVSIDSDGDRVAIGGGENDGTGSNAGFARVYEYSSGSWSQLGADIDGEAAGDLFGEAVSIDSDGDRVAIGGEENDGGGTNAGHARVYEYSGGSWSQLGADIDGKAAGDLFGGAVSIDSDGSHVAIGGRNNDVAGSNAGYVRVLEYNGTRWRVVGYDIDGDGDGDLFGEAVSIDSDGDRVAIGGPGENSVGYAGFFNPIDNDLPEVLGGALAADNSYIDITWDEKIYSTVNATGDLPRTSGGVNSSDANITFSQNGGNATAGTITGIKAPDNTAVGSASALVGGETIIRVFMSFTGLPSGVEQIYLVANANSFYDPHANAAVPGPMGPITLNDLKGPTMTITAAEGADGFTSNDATLSLTFTSSEATSNFVVGDITVSNGALSSFSTTSSTVYTATFTPTVDGAVTIDVAATTFTDASSNNNTAADQFNWTYDATGPTMAITAAEGSDGFTSNDATLSLTFTSNEVTTNFAVGDITVTNGALSSFSATSSTVYTATFTPTADGAVTIDVAAATFTDASSNNNTAADQFNWTYDTTGPTMVITAAEGADGFASNDATLTLTFTSNEATTNFAVGDITVTNGALSSFSATSSTVYTATFTLTADGAVTIDVAATTFTDASSNNNTAADQFNWNYDGTAPTIVFSPTNGSVGVALNTNITLTFNEPIRNSDNSALTDDNVDALIRLKTPIHSGADIGFDATIDLTKKVITVNPTTDFSFSQTVYVGIGESVEDSVNNAIISAAASFTTTDTNRAPVLYTIGNQSTFEDVAISLVMSATDADLDKVTFAGASSNSNVTVAINDSLLTLYPATNWHGTAVITIIVIDNGPRTLTDSESFILTVRPVNDAPTALALSPDTVKENLPSGVIVGFFTATDVDTGEIFTYNLISGDGSNDVDNDKFSIVHDTLRTSAIFDYEAEDTLIIRVQVRDTGGLSYEANELVFVRDEPEPEILLSSATLVFGDVITTHSSEKSLTISTIGSDTIVVDSVVLTGIEFSIGSKTFPVILAPNLSTDFNFTFSPLNPGNFNGLATFYSNNISGLKQVLLEGTGVNDTIPPVITILSTPITTTENNDITISVPVSDENKITDVVLYYRVGGDPSTYDMKATDKMDGTFSAVIEKGAVGINGLAYYHTAKDEYDNVSNGDTLSVEVQYGKDVLTSKINGSAYMNGIAKSIWRLISIPTHIDLNTVNETIGDELEKASSEQTWHLYEDKGNANWVEAQDIKIGKGYWLHQRMKDDISFGVGSGKSVDLRSHTIRIPSGWSLIGNPYPFEIKVSFDKSSVYGPLTYGKNGVEGWDKETSTILPWEGYAIFNRTSDSVSLSINPLSTEGSAQSKLLAEKGWEIILSADNGEYGDVYNAMGRRENASEEMDMWDNPEPPKMDKYISIAMDRKDWGAGYSFTTDIRSSGVENGTWKMNLKTKDVSGPIRLSSMLRGNLPNGLKVILFDHIERKSYSILEVDNIAITKFSHHYDYPMTLIVGEPSYVNGAVADIKASIPETFVLSQNYPNPFNPVTTIPFTVAVPTHVQISIYNLLGQKVAMLENRWFDMGQFQTTWNGKDTKGNPLSTGMYIYSIETAEFRKAKKLVFLK